MAKLALLIGVSEYQEGLNPLPAAVKDIEAMERVLLNPEMGGFDEVKRLANPDRQTMEEKIEALFSGCAREDLVVLFFSGHGIKDDSGKLYFTTRNTRKNEKGNLIRSTAVETRVVHNIMNNCRCKRQVVILDCCFSGAFDPALQPKGDLDLKTQLGAEGRVVLASSSSTQYSFEQPGADLSIYTRYLVEGIETGAASKNSQGKISILALHEYAASKVQETAPSMTPKIITLKDKGFEIVLAKARIADPKLKYRQTALRYANIGEISPGGRVRLNVLRQQLGLSAEEAETIETEVLRPYQERLENLQKYRKTLIAEAEYQYPLSEIAWEDLNWLQQTFGLRDKDVLPIQEEIKAQFAQQVGKGKSPTQKFAEYAREDLGNGVFLEMVKISGGTFPMGVPKGQGYDRERPQHEVTVPTFLMGKYPVTQAQWRVVAALPQRKIKLKTDPSYFEGDNRPVESISWHEAVEFCQRLSAFTGHLYRLPSEAEWEYACRAGTTTEYYFGVILTSELANFNDNIGETSLVGSYLPNAFGLYDMHGNVWEWCADHWHKNYLGAPTDGSAWIVNGNSEGRVVRGGSWYDFPVVCRAVCRSCYSPNVCSDAFGFRVLCAVYPGL